MVNHDSSFDFDFTLLLNKDEYWYECSFFTLDTNSIRR